MNDNPVSKIVAKYVDNDSVADAIEKAEEQMFVELKMWPTGAPQHVMVAENFAAAEAMLRLLFDLPLAALVTVHCCDESL